MFAARREVVDALQPHRWDCWLNFPAEAARGCSCDWQDIVDELIKAAQATVLRSVAQPFGTPEEAAQALVDGDTAYVDEYLRSRMGR